MILITKIVLGIVIILSVVSDKSAEKYTGMKHKSEYFYEQDFDKIEIKNR